MFILQAREDNPRIYFNNVTFPTLNSSFDKYNKIIFENF